MQSPILFLLLIISLSHLSILCISHDITSSRCLPPLYPHTHPSHHTIGIVSYTTPDISGYSQYSSVINEIYALLNRYSYRVLTPDSFNGDSHDARWNKVHIISQALESWAHSYHAVMWIDADAIFIDMNFKIESLLESYPHADIIISAESAGSKTLVNTGTIIARQTEWTKEFMREWWGSPMDRRMQSDQERFDKIYTRHRAMEDSIQDRIVVLPPDAINSDPPAKSKLLPHNPVLHLMGESQMFRESVFARALSTLCEDISSQQCPQESAECPLQLPHQLGLSVDVMQQLSFKIYSEEFDQLYELYSVKASSGGNSLQDCSLLSNAAKHYSEALEFQAEQSNEAEKLNIILQALDIRKKTFETVLLNVNQHRYLAITHRNETGRILPYWPEMLRCAVGVGRAVVSAVVGQSIKDRLRAAEEVMDILEEMRNISNPNQTDIINQMQASLYKDVGMIAYDAGKPDLAVKYLTISLDMLTAISTTSGEHMTVNVMSLLASSLAAIGNFTESLKLFNQSVDIAATHLGPMHHVVMEIRLNYAVAAFLAKDYELSEVQAKKSLMALDHHRELKNERHRETVEYILEQISLKKVTTIE